MHGGLRSKRGKSATHSATLSRPPTRLPVETLETAEVQSLLAACSGRAPSGLRNRALLVVLWRGMLRINEALHLKPADFDPQHGTLRVLVGKGRKARTVGIDPASADYRHPGQVCAGGLPLVGCERVREDERSFWNFGWSGASH